MGRMPSAVGYQPTLAAEVGALQERITSTLSGSITSVQAVYVPADDYSDPAPATVFAHLDATVALERTIAELGTLPGRRSFGLELAHPRPEHRRRGALSHGARGAECLAAIPGPAGYHRHPGCARAKRRRSVARGTSAQSSALFVSANVRGIILYPSARDVTCPSPRRCAAFEPFSMAR